MSPCGRPKGESLNAKHEGSPVSLWPRLLLAVTLAAALGHGRAQVTAQIPPQAPPHALQPAPTHSPPQAPPQAPAPASPNPAEPIALDLREAVHRIEVRVNDMFGREASRRIPITVFRPPGDGPHPLIILSHGRAPAEQRAQQGRQRFEHTARYLVSLGFVVLVPTRVGYGETYGDFDPEQGGGCQVMRLEPAAAAASDQVLAALEHARSLPFVDTTRWLAVGISVGGFTSLAVAARQPPGLVGSINFAGGIGGDPLRRQGEPCRPAALQSLWKAQASTAKVPTLWLYWANDKYWGDEHPRRWHQAWLDGGGSAEFHSLPAVGADGHSGMGIDMNTWTPVVEAYLASVGLIGRSGQVARPSPTAFAEVTQTDKVPITAANRETVYQRFLRSPMPRAFAIGPRGQSGWASGDWAMGRALGFCQRLGQACKLYAVDDDVVWVP